LTISSLSKSDPTIYSLRWTVVVTYLNRQSSDANPLTEIPNLNQTRATKTLIAPIWFYVEIIHASDNTAVFHRVFESENDVSNVVMFCLDNPDEPQALIREDCCKCPSRTYVVEIIASLSVELRHQPHQQRDVIGTRSSHLTIIEGYLLNGSVE
jgi:hypothetical protein